MTNTVFNMLIATLIIAILFLWVWRSRRHHNKADIPKRPWLLDNGVHHEAAEAHGKQLAEAYDQHIIDTVTAMTAPYGTKPRHIPPTLRDTFEPDADDAYMATLPMLKAHGVPRTSDHRHRARIFNLGARHLAANPRSL